MRFIKGFLFPTLLICGCVGVQGPAGQRGVSGANGNDGRSIVGPQGPPGESITGPAGRDGLDGRNGVDGTIIQGIQFCPQTTDYPNTFVEIGFCIDNNLYAVYSANDGFLTLIPPGTYYSNGINSSCTFTVLPNCTITH